MDIELLTAEEASEIFKVTKKRLDSWRYNDRGPDYVMVGGQVRYRMEDIQKYIESKTVTPKKEK